MISKIVTHPGGAHKDDFLAVSVLISLHSAPVERRIPTEEEKSDPKVALVDIGGSHDPALSNFDHHHFPREHEPTCALSLVLQHLDLYEDAKMFCDWLEPAEWFDSRGPNQTAAWLGIARDTVARLNSPIDVTFLRRFARATHLKVGDTLYEAMRYIGDDLLEFLRSARRRLDLTASLAQRWTLYADGTSEKNSGSAGAEPTLRDGDQVGQQEDVILAIFLPRGESSPDEPSASLARYVRAQGLQNRVAALIYPDRRGEGYGISRFEDHPKLDFSRVDQESDVHFAHVSGFMCKTSATEPERLMSLVRAAWR